MLGFGEFVGLWLLLRMGRKGGSFRTRLYICNLHIVFIADQLRIDISRPDHGAEPGRINPGLCHVADRLSPLHHGVERANPADDYGGILLCLAAEQVARDPFSAFLQSPSACR